MTDRERVLSDLKHAINSMPTTPGLHYNDFRPEVEALMKACTQEGESYAIERVKGLDWEKVSLEWFEWLLELIDGANAPNGKEGGERLRDLILKELESGVDKV